VGGWFKLSHSKKFLPFMDYLKHIFFKSGLKYKFTYILKNKKIKKQNSTKRTRRWKLKVKINENNIFMNQWAYLFVTNM
jgi:hypothetical protein